jgi:Icc-related predicted phosphoesterase
VKITLISDTHNKHKQVTSSLPGGDLLLHAGDISSMGHQHEIREFCKWFRDLNYKRKVFIAGNHDWGFQREPVKSREIVDFYAGIDYVEDVTLEIEGVKIWGSPWQPWFYNWAFNLPRGGEALEKVWNEIPVGIDILITHSPSKGTLDTVEGRRHDELGCELLTKRISEVRPKIHVCGHIHTGYGYVYKDGTHFFNAAVLDERYLYTQKPLNFDWDPKTNKIKFT